MTAGDRTLSTLFHPYTQEPRDPQVSALIAIPTEEDGEVFAYLAEGIWLWKNGQWVSEKGERPLVCERFWWVDEKELLAGLVALPRAGVAA